MPDADAQSGPDPSTVSRLLRAASEGDASAPEQLFALVYDELRALARNRMAGERRDHTLQATALVNEAYMKLMGRVEVKWQGRRHFYAAAAEAMRRILVDHARARNADKRGGGRAALAASNIADLAMTTEPAGILALDDAITRLEGADPQAAAVVRLRFYAGLEVEAVAEALEISPRTVRREWAFARAWLRETLQREATDL